MHFGQSLNTGQPGGDAQPQREWALVLTELSEEKHGQSAYHSPSSWVQPRRPLSAPRDNTIGDIVCESATILMPIPSPEQHSAELSILLLYSFFCFCLYKVEVFIATV